MANILKLMGSIKFSLILPILLIITASVTLSTAAYNVCWGKRIIGTYSYSYFVQDVYHCIQLCNLNTTCTEITFDLFNTFGTNCFYYRPCDNYTLETDALNWGWWSKNQTIFGCSQKVCGNLQEGQLFYFANFQNCYLDMNGFSKNPGDKFQTYAIQSPTKTNQMYYIKQHPSLNYYLIISYDSNMTLDMNSTSAQLAQQKPHCGISQQFKFVSDINNTCYIYSALNPNASLLTSASAASCGSKPITISSLPFSRFQRWSFFQVPNPYQPTFYPTCLQPPSTKNFVSTNPPTTSAKYASTFEATSLITKQNTLSTIKSSIQTKAQYNNSFTDAITTKSTSFSMQSNKDTAPMSLQNFTSSSKLTKPSTTVIKSVDSTIKNTLHESTKDTWTQTSHKSSEVTTQTLHEFPEDTTQVATSVARHHFQQTSGKEDQLSQEITLQQPLTTKGSMQCIVGMWTSFGPCSATCGLNALRKRSRPITQAGSPCLFTLEEAEQCDVQPCSPMTQMQQEVAFVLQTIGCAWIIGLSAGSLALSILFWSWKTERSLHASEELCLLLAHCIISYARSETKHKIICVFAGIGLQYFFLVHFTSLTLESLHIFSTVTSVTNGESYFTMKANMLMAWGNGLYLIFYYQQTMLFFDSGIPLIITALTASTSYNNYISKYSCWLNIGNNISVATFLPVFCCTCISAVLLESSSQFNTDVAKAKEPGAIISAKIIQRGLLFILPINFASWLIGTIAIYEQNFAWFIVVFKLNLAMGISIIFFHTLSNEKGRDFAVTIWKKVFKCNYKN